MQRVLEMILAKAWVTAAEALEYSESILHRLLLCQHLFRDVEQRLSQELVTPKRSDRKIKQPLK